MHRSNFHLNFGMLTLLIYEKSNNTIKLATDVSFICIIQTHSTIITEIYLKLIFQPQGCMVATNCYQKWTQHPKIRWICFLQNPQMLKI